MIKETFRAQDSAVEQSIHLGLPFRELISGCAPGSLSQIDDDIVAYHFHEPLGAVGQIIRGTSRC